jgi:hypothetical protein
LQKRTAQALSRARWISICSRSNGLPRWYGDAEMFATTCAPERATVVTGGPGSQMSSQTVRPMPIPFSSAIAGWVPAWK